MAACSHALQIVALLVSMGETGKEGGERTFVAQNTDGSKAQEAGFGNYREPPEPDLWYYPTMLGHRKPNVVRLRTHSQ